MNDPGGVLIDAIPLTNGLTLHGGTGNNRIFNIATDTACTLFGLTLTSGDVTGNHGGAILNAGRLTLDCCTLAGNTSSGGGGAIRNASSGRLSLERCTLANNTAVFGGAIWSSGAMNLIHCTVSGNTASSGTGGLVIETGVHCLVDTIVAGNTGAADHDIGGSGATLRRAGANIVGRAAQYPTELPFGSPNANGDFVGSNALPVNAQLSPLASNGGSTQTMAPGLTSPARDAAGAQVQSFIVLGSTTGTFTLAFKGQTTSALPFNATGTQVGNALNALSTIGGVGGGVSVVKISTSFTVTFGGALEGTAVPLLTGNGTGGTQVAAFNAGASLFTDQRGRTNLGPVDIGAFELQRGTFRLSAPTYAVLEGQPVEVTINRGADLAGNVPVRLITTTPGTATGGTDFTARANATASDFTFAEGQASAPVLIPTTADFTIESSETFTVALSFPAPTAGAALGTPSTALVTIQSPIVVTTTFDDGPGSLRQAFRDAAARSGPDIIQFDATRLNGATITLGSQIAVNDAGGVTVDAGNLTAGVTIDGGAGTNRIFGVVGTLTLRSLTLTGGNGDGVRGGAIDNVGTLTLERCTLSGNTAGTGGGAIYNGAFATATLTQCTLTGNTAADSGGAIYNSPDATATLTHCTLSGNAAGNDGGGIFNEFFGTVTLDRCIVAGNSAGSPASGDIHNDAPFGALTFVGASIVPNLSSGGTINNGFNQSISNPLLGPLAANGGPTKTHALLAGSPARNAGTGSTFTKDQRGRPVLGPPDLGAFEAQQGESQFVFSATGYLVNEGSPVMVTIRRTGDYTGAASVKLTTTAGTATSPTDFTARTTANLPVDFPDGVSEVTVPIDTATDALIEGNHSFTVMLGTPTGIPRPTIPVITATVTILDANLAANDSVAPAAPTITSPAANAIRFAPVGGTVTITGTATDEKGVQSVELFSSTGLPLPATITLEKPGATSTNWTATYAPVGGVNAVKARTTDFAGHTSPFSALRTFTVQRPLELSVAGNGGIYNSENVLLPPGLVLLVGQPAPVIARAGDGSIFAGWSILSGHTPQQLGLTAAALEKPTITFTFREGLVLRATFVPTPFVAAVQGTYNGGILPAGPADMSTVGYISATVTGTGAFSGQLLLDGLQLAVAGTFDLSGDARFGTSRAKVLSVSRGPEKPALQVALHLDTGLKHISGNVTQLDGAPGAVVPVANSTVSADRAAYSSTNPVPAAFLTSPGYYTMHFDPAGGGPAALTPDSFPQGHGYAGVTVLSTGTVQVTGYLADSAFFTQSTTLSQFNAFRLHGALYGIGDGAGVVAGDVQFDHNVPDSDLMLAGPAFWFRPVGAVGTGTNLNFTLPGAAQCYTAGWPEGILVNGSGAKFIATPSVAVLPGLPASDADGNANLDLSQGLLDAAGLHKTVGITAATGTATTETVVKVPADNTFSLTVGRNGLFSGTFTHSNGFTGGYYGIIHQKGSQKGGYGFFLSPSLGTGDYSMQSGAVRLTGQ